MEIKQSVKNTLNRVGIPYDKLMTETEKVTVENRFGGGSCETTPLVAYLIKWVYKVNNQFDLGMKPVRLDDFDRIRYFVMEVDSNAYMTCLD